MRASALILLFSAALIAVTTNSVTAAVAKSVDYSLEYGSVNAGSATASSGSYNMVSTITSDGVGGQSACSASYSILPAVGGTTPAAKISDWALY